MGHWFSFLLKSPHLSCEDFPLHVDHQRRTRVMGIRRKRQTFPQELSSHLQAALI